MRVGSATGTREPARFEPSSQTLWLDPAHPLVRAALAMPRARGTRVLVLAASGVLNRALERVRDEDEQRAVDELLDQVISSG